MNAYVYQADLYCEECALEIIAKLRKPLEEQAEKQANDVAIDLETRFGIDPDKWPKFFTMLENKALAKLVPDMDDESSYDSGEWPKGPYSDGGGESDIPNHCASCSEFLENPLTSDGLEYVTAHENSIWDDFYGISREVEE